MTSSFSHKFSGETTLSVREVYHQGAESFMSALEEDYNRYEMCQQGELTLGHKDIVQSDETGLGGTFGMIMG